jgi:hypothetical protein
MEVWKDIPGYEGRYQASNLGRIRSLTRKVRIGINYRTAEGQILRQFDITQKGYKGVCLSRKLKYVHKLVAMTFLQHTPDGFNTTVDHIDFDKSNNSVDNLRLISHAENSARTRRSKQVGHLLQQS